jgi:DNA-binding MarR family transcriptional regulator
MTALSAGRTAAREAGVAPAGATPRPAVSPPAGTGDAPRTGASAVPPRAEWPQPPGATPAGAALTDVIVETFRLNGRLQKVAQQLAAKGQITAAWWQVLGGVLDEPRSVADVALRMGMTRQGVQRVADLLAERGLAEYRPNPAHRRAKLLACTEAGYWAIRRIAIAQHPWAARIGEQVGTDELRAAVATMRRLVAALDVDERQGPAA